MANDAQVMGDKQIGQSELFLKILEHIDDLRLNGNIERGDRLIADDELGIDRQRSRNTDSLALTAGELMRIAVCVLAVESDALKKGDYAVVAAPALLAARWWISMGSPTISPYGHARVKARIGVLENHLHFAADRAAYRAAILFSLSKMTFPS